MASTFPTYPVGTILSVRGYANGDQLPARLAVVIAEAGGAAGERAALWFYGQGAPKIGSTVQPLYRDSEYTETGRDMFDMSPATLSRWERLLSAQTGYLLAFGWKVHNARVRLSAAA